MALLFKNPPPANTGGPGGKASAEHLLAAHELRQRPDEGAILRSCDTASRAAGLVKRVKDGSIIAFAPVGTFNACYRNEGGRFVVYAVFGDFPDATLKAAPVVAKPAPRAKVAARRIVKAG